MLNELPDVIDDIELFNPSNTQKLVVDLPSANAGACIDGVNRAQSSQLTYDHNRPMSPHYPFESMADDSGFANFPT